MSANVETMAYVGETPWHGLGHRLPENPTPDEMRVAAGLTWEPEIRPLEYVHAGNVRRSAARVLVRNDTGYELDVVGGKYTPILNSQVIDFFREYVDAGDLTLETAGVLDNGRYVWALAKMSAGFDVGAGDRVEGYVLLANAHRYGQGATAKFTGVRVVCWNTMQQALAGAGAATKIWHVKEFNADRRAAVQAQMGIARDHLTDYQTAAEQLAAFRLDTPTARTLALRIMATAGAATKKVNVMDDTDWEKAPDAVVRVLNLYAGAAKGAALPSATDTAWGLFNAVTQYTDWESGRTANVRTRNAWFGSGAATKARALRTLTDAATARGVAA